ncbi:unnamed protein product [Durusdinium trenchii]|uniref:Uncharacterized protein n=1 Tax=Durusdinium trenchii TaxID=1381693 RepID=A0ABP0MJV9_9DINO
MSIAPLVDLAQTLQEVAALSGHASQAQRSARIAAQLSDEPRAAVGAVSPPPSGVGTTLHVSLRELHEGRERHESELQSLQSKLSQAEQQLKYLAEEMRSHVRDLTEEVASLGTAQADDRQWMKAHKHEMLVDLESLTQALQDNKASLEDHDARIVANLTAEREARAASSDALRRLKEKIEEIDGKMQEMRRTHEDESTQQSSRLSEVQQAFSSLESEVLQTCSNHRNAVQSTQQESLEQLTEVRHLLHQHYREHQDQFKSFQQLMQEAKQASEVGLNELTLRLDKALWQRPEQMSPRAEPLTQVTRPFSPRVVVVEEGPASPLCRHSPCVARSPCSPGTGAAWSMAMEEMRQTLEMKLDHLESKMKRSIKHLAEDLAQKHLHLSSALEKSSGVQEERLSEFQCCMLRTWKAEWQPELQRLKETERGVMDDLQSKVQRACKDAEAASTQTRSLQKVQKHVDDKLQDMRVSLEQHQVQLDTLKGDVAPLPSAIKRGDDLWRHLEGVKAGIETLDRNTRAEILALGQHLEAQVRPGRTVPVPVGAGTAGPTNPVGPTTTWVSEPVATAPRAHARRPVPWTIPSPGLSDAPPIGPK